ncbi:hypothetical protein PCIT_a0339 [Pseudoalteromonas citrea]|uniref:YgjP-like metallopeptidase domain-containing protein n=2 Tax=Pseudoalteromonas citrea TaxID=43655 RepID=A0AAD4AKL3_9GAMM|nr:YgjP-like metallopeptidase domain-containing protein [Pseudoalteromonas citrea]KAF7773974.1 hypothetical protein PCIT_a0339 [Pseudoalteromonas citrea]
MFEYQLKESTRRRSVAIKVTGEGVIVYAPKGLEKKRLQEWLVSKRSWVLAKQQKMQAVPVFQAPWHTQTLLVFGETYACFFGPEYQSKLCHSNRIVHVCVINSDDKQACRAALLSLLRIELESYVMGVLPLLAEKMDAHVNQVKFREYKSRWGSCTSNRALAFNTLLIGAKPSYIDYVIIHELAHCHVLAHNPKFWQLVLQHYGQYKGVVKWFREKGTTLFIAKEV